MKIDGRRLRIEALRNICKILSNLRCLVNARHIPVTEIKTF